MRRNFFNDEIFTNYSITIAAIQKIQLTLLFAKRPVIR